MQKHILHIKLMNRPGAGDGQGEHGADHDQLDHWAKGLNVVDVGSLGEAAKNPVSLVPVQGAVGVELVLENPLAGDDVGANWARDKIPCVVGDKGSKLFFHGVAPVWIDEGITDGEGTGDKVDTEVADRSSLSAGSLASVVWSSNEDCPEVPLVRPSLAVTANVEEVSVALAQPKGDTSSGAGRASEPRVEASESATQSVTVGRVKAMVLKELASDC
jgi:hypothetical protein